MVKAITSKNVLLYGSRDAQPATIEFENGVITAIWLEYASPKTSVESLIDLKDAHLLPGLVGKLCYPCSVTFKLL